MKTDMSEIELDALIKQYAEFYHKKFKWQYGLDFVERDEIWGRLQEIAVNAANKYRKTDGHKASMKTYIIQSFRNRMYNYRTRELHKEQKMIIKNQKIAAQFKVVDDEHQIK